MPWLLRRIAFYETRSRVVSRKVLNGLNRKTSLSKGFSKRTTAEILVSRLLKLSLRKVPVQIFGYLTSKVLCINNIYQSLDVHSEKAVSLESPHCLDRERTLWKEFLKCWAGKLSFLCLS